MKRKQRSASSIDILIPSRKKPKSKEKNKPTLPPNSPPVSRSGPWWSQRSAIVSSLLTKPFHSVVDDKPLTWISRTEYQSDSPYYAQVHTQRNLKQKRQRKHTTGMSKKKFEIDDIMRSRKIRVMPTTQQKLIFHNHWVNTARYLYNETLRMVEHEGYTGRKENCKALLLDYFFLVFLFLNFHVTQYNKFVEMLSLDCL